MIKYYIRCVKDGYFHNAELTRKGFEKLYQTGGDDIVYGSEGDGTLCLVSPLGGMDYNTIPKSYIQKGEV